MDEHVSARRFDVLMLNFQLALIGKKVVTKFAKKLQRSCAVLKKKDNIPMVKERMDTIEHVLTEQFLNNAKVVDLEEVRLALRDIMRFLEAKDQKDVETHFKDYLDLASIKEMHVLEPSSGLEPYRKRVEKYLQEHNDHLVIRKIKTNQTITEAELELLESIFFNADEVGSKEEYEQTGEGKSLTLFIREIIGLEREAVQQAFSDFINSGNLNAAQIKFLDLVIGYLSKNGVIDKKVLFESPFKDLNDNGPFGLFDDAQVSKIISILDRINGSADVG